MFERYTEQARRVIFFARWEASQLGSTEITPEHLLLALLREAEGLVKSLAPGLTRKWARHEIEKHAPPAAQIATSADMPLSQSAKRVLESAAEEAERLNHKHIGGEHLLIALGREKSLASVMLHQHGFSLEKARAAARVMTPSSKSTRAEFGTLFTWEKRQCEPGDALRNRSDNRLSLYHGQPFDSSQFEIVKSGWIYTHCAACWKDLYDPQNPQGSIGYTNGQDWLCGPCHEFAVRDF